MTKPSAGPPLAQFGLDSPKSLAVRQTDPLEIDLDFGAGGHLYATHQLHAFAARCPPPLARWAIERYSTSGDIVLDPMCGSGTTLIEAALTGRQGWGVDIDPLARLVAEAKSVTVDASAVRGLADIVEARVAGGVTDDGWRPDLLNLSKWFDDEVAADLARLRALLADLAPVGALRALAWAAFSSLIVARTSVANARDLVHSRHHFQAKQSRPDVTGRYVRALRRAASLHSEYRQLLAESGGEAASPRLVGTGCPPPVGRIWICRTRVHVAALLLGAGLHPGPYVRGDLFAGGWPPGCSA